jgi:AraC-like DNA-binding protein
VPLDRHTEEAWNHLLACLASDASPVLQTHYAESVLLALCLAGHAGPLLTDRRDPLGARVQQLLMLDPAMDWTVSMVAEHLHVGASTLRRQLAAEERSFRDILSGVRLGMALQWLQNTKRPIGEIAEASGYASASRFSVRFRAHYGLSPRDLRAAM